MRVGVVLVHYRTPHLARDAIEALRRSEGIEEGELDLVVVDNGSDDAGREVLESLPARLITPGGNLGYAGGANLGVAQLMPRKPDVLVLMNPDVHVGSLCLVELIRALEVGTLRGVGVVGPRFVWGEVDGAGDDEDGGGGDSAVLLPPAEEWGRRRQLARYLAESRGGAWAKKARVAWRRHAQHHWMATADLPSHALSGALLAISADAWGRVGRFDEGFRLYFEESDWLRRAQKEGVAGRYVPTAEARHGYARSTPQEPRAAAWFAESERRFRRRWYGRSFAAVLERLARRSPPRPGEVGDGAEGHPRLGPDVRWIEISASSLGLPAGGLYRPQGVDPARDPLPEIVRTRAREMALYWRTVDAAGHESASSLVG